MPRILPSLELIALQALLYYHLDDEVRAGRAISVAARLCLELGLNRTETFQRNGLEKHDLSPATTLFWCVYLLDRRSCIGLGVPFIVQDSDIDPSLPRPVSSTFLRKHPQMIHWPNSFVHIALEVSLPGYYGRLHTTLWYCMPEDNSSPGSEHSISCRRCRLSGLQGPSMAQTNSLRSDVGYLRAPNKSAGTNRNVKIDLHISGGCTSVPN